MNTPSRARLEELLSAEATQPLSLDEEIELDGLLAAFPDQDPDAFELAAAAVHLALSGEDERLPAALAEKLHLTTVAMMPARRAEPAKTQRSLTSSIATWAGWAVAAGLAGVLVYNQSRPPQVAQIEPPPPPTIDQKREALVKSAEAKPVRFAPKDNASANVVWSDVKQEGYLEVRGLPANDPKKERYQLWVIDATRKDQKPISAGLFDVKAGAPTLVQVSASLPVGDAAAFAISREPPNGGPQPTQILLVMPAKAG